MSETKKLLELKKILSDLMQWTDENIKLFSYYEWNTIAEIKPRLEALIQYLEKHER